MKTRVLSALIASAIVLPFILIGKIYFAIAIGIAAILAYREIVNLKKTHLPYPIFVIILGLVSLLFITYCNFLESSILWGLSYEKLIVVCLALIIPAVFCCEEKYTMRDAFALIGMLLFLGIGFNSLILVRNMGIKIFFYLVTIPIFTDTFALLIGLKFGKHKMCPKVSPKKSWEGAVGGFVLGSILPCIIYFLMFNTINVKIIIITMILSIIGQIGDLIFSKIKRENDIKDFSNLMPGHGGVLDRLDSTLVIFMMYVLLASILL